MAYLLRSLLVVMVVGILATAAAGMRLIDSSHILLALSSFFVCLFVQAFVMFYFIGISRMVNNIHNVLHSSERLDELFEEAPEDLTPYKHKLRQYVHQSTLGKRKTIPWTMLMVVLGMLAFFLGAAFDNGMVSRKIHAGLVYGFAASVAIGVFHQWIYLGKSHKLLREIKALFQLPDAQM